MSRMLGPEQHLSEEEPYYPDPGKELVLGAPALVGVFFAIAVICAVCFGIGYSSGHGFHLPAQPAPITAFAPHHPAPRSPVPLPTAPAPVPAFPAPLSEATVAVPATPLEQNQEQSAWPPAGGPEALARRSNTLPRQTPSAESPSAESEEAFAVSPHATEAARTSHLPSKQSAMTPLTRSLPGTTTISPTARGGLEAEATDTGITLMVQIAAVTHAADAQTLAAALRHDGFAAIVRTGLNDRLFHVQVGPYPSLQAANSMRERLAGSGYNAFVKP